MIGTFFDSAGLWIELIEPATPGPVQDILDDFGDGTLVEINFDLGNEYGLALEKLAARGVEMLSMDGSPLIDGGTIDEGVFEDGEIKDTGQRIAYFPKSLTHGATVEYYEVISGDTGSLLAERDRFWRDETRAPGPPWIDHVAILTDDAERVAAFYADYMGLKRQPGSIDEGGDKIVLIDANGADDNKLWLRLVQPAPGGRAAKILEARGTGHMVEMGGVVGNLAGFCSRIAHHGTTLEDDRCADFVAVGSGQRAYFRAEDNCGIPIRVMEGR